MLGGPDVSADEGVSMQVTRSRRGWRGQLGRVTGAGCTLVLVLVGVSACVGAPPRAGAGTTVAASDTMSGTTSTPEPWSSENVAATARLDTGTPSASTSNCQDAVGAMLRERTTVTTTSLVTVVAGALPCAGIGLWAATFALDGDPTVDPLPQFGARYTGARQLAVRLPSVAVRCTAAAVFFSPDADTSGEAQTAAATAARVRSDLGSWPADAKQLVPGGAILQGRSSPLLAASVVGDPSGCSPGESVASPIAAAGDCWTAVPAGAAASSTRFRRTTCIEPHTHEVYWAAALRTEDYLAQGQPAGLGAAAWARSQAEKVCADRSDNVTLATGVDRARVFLELLWPATLSYPPTGTNGWSKAQLVCLARWKDGKASTQQLLRR